MCFRCAVSRHVCFSLLGYDTFQRHGMFPSSLNLTMGLPSPVILKCFRARRTETIPRSFMMKPLALVIARRRMTTIPTCCFALLDNILFLGHNMI